MTDHRPQLRHRLPRGGDCCDFCGIQDVHSLHSCANFIWEDKPVFQADHGRWTACWQCSEYVDSQKWGLLTRRVMRAISKRKGVTGADLDALRSSVKKLHALFAQHVVQGEALKVHRPHLRRFILTEAKI